MKVTMSQFLTMCVVFGSPVPGPEKDWGWTRLGPIRTGFPRTAKDRNRSPVCGLLPFRKFRDRPKTSQDRSGLVFTTSKGEVSLLLNLNLLTNNFCIFDLMTTPNIATSTTLSTFTKCESLSNHHAAQPHAPPSKCETVVCHEDKRAYKVRLKFIIF